MNVVEISGLVKKYKNITALNNISLNIEEGIIYGLLGPNGSGKSTLINILSGVVKYDKGYCNVLGKEVKSNRQYIKKYIGVVPQEYSFYDDLKVVENLELFGMLYGVKRNIIRDRIGKILKKLDLYEYRNRYPSSFSGGMKRRVNIACSLIHEPKILIMDEPTASLDPIARDYVLSFVKEINNEGCTVIYTSHHLEEVDYLCHREVILSKGIVMAEGKTKDINNIFKNNNIINIRINTMNESTLRKIKDINKEVLFLSYANITVDEKNNNISIECDNQSIVLEKILIFLRENKISISDISIKKASLEETFIRIINK